MCASPGDGFAFEGEGDFLNTVGLSKPPPLGLFCAIVDGTLEPN